MAVVLKVTPEEMKTLAGDMRTEIQAINTSLGNLRHIVSGMQAYWRGDASDKHTSINDELFPQGDTLIKNLNTAPDDLLKIAGLYEETELELQQVAAQLPEDIF